MVIEKNCTLGREGIDHPFFTIFGNALPNIVKIIGLITTLLLVTDFFDNVLWNYRLKPCNSHEGDA